MHYEDESDSESVPPSDADRDDAETQEYLEFLQATRNANTAVGGGPVDLRISNYAARAQEHLEEVLRDGRAMRISTRGYLSELD